eukprot:TRINITY_DN21177_c0_g4_i2.p1 TRINITY_DN21177_c0_g4~~TRINITY_DN21177_c0_g4_i2.p1  ORF type:complete len:175 (+),score=15.60 TRINITY_DN21177_c0_g4_i2:110-634(+)
MQTPLESAAAVAVPTTGMLAQIGSAPKTERREGIKRIDFVPKKQKSIWEGCKRSFEWTHHPTAWNNPLTYEDPPVPGRRPTHPVAPDGVAATEQKRTFPEISNVPTGIIPQSLCKAPQGCQWGGWGGSDGAPGRRKLDGPWDSMRGSLSRGMLALQTRRQISASLMPACRSSQR